MEMINFLILPYCINNPNFLNKHYLKIICLINIVFNIFFNFLI